MGLCDKQRCTTEQRVSEEIEWCCLLIVQHGVSCVIISQLTYCGVACRRHTIACKYLDSNVCSPQTECRASGGLGLFSRNVLLLLTLWPLLRLW